MAALSEPEYVRICPTCGTQHLPQEVRCACGVLLVGVDLVRPPSAVVEVPAIEVPPTETDAQVERVCPFEDCAQPNPPGSETCLYCNRPLGVTKPATPPLPEAPDLGLLQLPSTLQARYRVLEALPASGAEAELSLVVPRAGGPTLLAKLYRKGVMPKQPVRERLARVDEAHRTHIVEEGVADGFAYEVMEYCALGSLRAWLGEGVPEALLLRDWIREIADALADVHAVGLVHRDLKPENILVRMRAPVDLVLTDFGIASVLEATQCFTTDARTLSYAAPESLSGVIDAKADFWALGMIVLEATLGRHPFAGFSDPVILHQLTTRSVDLSGVHDVALRKLLRGLLLRDPQRRWGHAEITRWLADDATLPEETESGATAHFAQAYRIAGEACGTPLQLATALTRHWNAGAADIANGQLLAWFRDVLHDQDVVRLLLSMRFEHGERPIHVDMQLLHLILHLAPGVPPVWRGESVELHAILRKASRALKGDADAAHWLDVVHQRRVLQVYADAGNAEAMDLVARWDQAVQTFGDAWRQRVALLERKETERPDRVVFYDEVVYGGDGPKRPPLSRLHPRLLAMAYDPTWGERLRKRILAELVPARVACPWLAELGDPMRMAAAELLVLEALLPDAKKAATTQQAVEDGRRKAQAAELNALRAAYRQILGALRDNACAAHLGDDACEALLQDASRYDELLGPLNAADATQPEWRAFRKEVVGVQGAVERLRDAVSELMQRRAVNRAWFSAPVAVFAGLVVLFLPALRGPWVALVLIAVGGVVMWRLLPDRGLRRRIRGLGERLPLGSDE